MWVKNLTNRVHSRIIKDCVHTHFYRLYTAEGLKMKQEIHPNYNEISVICACGHSFKTRSTLGEDLHVEICADCHPFFTGKQKLVDTAGRVDRFNKRYARGAAETK